MAEKKRTAAAPGTPIPISHDLSLRLFELFGELSGLVGDLGRNDAVTVLYRLERAVTNPDEVADGESRTNAQALEQMARAAGIAVGGRGRKAKPTTRAFDVLVQMVENERTAKTAPEAIVTMVLWGWVDSLGRTVENTARVRALNASPTELAALHDRNPTKLVKKAFQALGYERADNLENAKSKQRSRQHRARKTTP